MKVCSELHRWERCRGRQKCPARSSSVTRGNRTAILKLVVHPWFTQGTAAFMTYQPPMTYSQISSAWEARMVQDYASINNLQFSLN